MKTDLPGKVLEYVERLELEHATALVAVFDRHGFYLYASPNHEAALGYTADELMGMHLSQTVEPSKHHAAWVLRTISVLYSQPLPFSTRLVGKNGDLVAISGTVRHLRDTTGDLYFVTCVNPGHKP